MKRLVASVARFVKTVRLERGADRGKDGWKRGWPKKSCRIEHCYFGGIDFAECLAVSLSLDRFARASA